MAFELRQQLRLTQQLVMTPQLQQAIKLLQLNRLELMDLLTLELKENPALEEEPNLTYEEQVSIDQLNKKNEKQNEIEEININEQIKKDADWENYIGEYNSVSRTNFESENKESPKFESFISNKQSLEEHLLWQLMMLQPSPEEEKIGSIIIGNINNDGYLDISDEELIDISNSSIENINKIFKRMQTFNPVGVCARTLSECLLIQIEHYGINDNLIINIVKNHIKNLENKNYKAISKGLKVHLNDVIRSVNIIKELEPKPGRSFSDETSHYIIPDIYIYKYEDEFIISLNDDGMPKLRINPYFKRAVSEGQEISNEIKEYLQGKMRSAAWLIKSIHQRQKTIYNVMGSILKFQKNFFEKGISHLKPMVLRDVAEDIGMHESTISRVTTNKYAFTPQGIFELKYFFNSSINRVHGSAIASASVHDKIKKIIENENPKKPFSDLKIADMLKKENVNIARRTVAKYREKLKILPSSKRKQY